MRKLLSANFARLWKDMTFWVTLLVVFFTCFVSMRNGARSVSPLSPNSIFETLDYYFFSPAPYMAIAYAAFISMFLGTEYSDGTMRNKLVVGHTRINVYLANVLVCFVACLLFMVAWFMGGIPGLIWMGSFQMGAGEFWVYVLVVIGFTASFVALFTWISTVSTNKARTVLFTLAIWMGLVFVVSKIGNRLDMPQMNEDVVYLSGEPVALNRTPNPLYLDGIVRKIFEYLYEFIPVGQTMLMHDVAIKHPIRQIIFSLVFTVYAILNGIVAFCRKDLN